MKELTEVEKMQAIQVLDPDASITITLEKDPSWFVMTNLRIKNSLHSSSSIGSWSISFHDTIDRAFAELTAPDIYVYSGKNNKYYQWVGFMWKEVAKEDLRFPKYGNK
jgi:hypothetical protein